MNRLSLRNQQLKFKTSEKLPIILEKSLEYNLNLIKKNQKIITCNGLGLGALGFDR
jgi:hypothetical protein